MDRKRILIGLVVFAVLAAGASSAYALTRGAGAADPAPRVAAASVAPAQAQAASSADLGRANAVLRDLQQKYRLLDDVTVRIGKTPAGEQAIAYYEDGEIVVSPERSATIQRILAHEIWHVIDWRDNGRLDWGEDLPPADASQYLRARP